MPRAKTNSKNNSDIEVLKALFEEMRADVAEVKQDVKRLLIFRAYVWGGAAAISAVISFVLQAIFGRG